MMTQFLGGSQAHAAGCFFVDGCRYKQGECSRCVESWHETCEAIHPPTACVLSPRNASVPKVEVSRSSSASKRSSDHNYNRNNNNNNRKKKTKKKKKKKKKRTRTKMKNNEDEGFVLPVCTLAIPSVLFSNAMGVKNGMAVQSTTL